ncbi:MAG TPA: lasso peptide biosynthesis B2 protein [Thermoanaerobaculia bacterium]|nr:lasso peptide biosynthesis B2 protein [Thermoanaerobaculia bacterium]HQR65943.1 lasso peptide biosynthesis B2 protein [Thermoanaerobaculia bacterium]
MTIWLRLHLTAVLCALSVRRDLARDKPLLPDSTTAKKRQAPSPDVVVTALLASRRAVARLSPLNTCLTRSVVLYRLLERYDGVAIHFGFRRREGALEGHAWVTVDGEAVGEPDGALDGYTEAATPPPTAAFG